MVSQEKGKFPYETFTLIKLNAQELISTRPNVTITQGQFSQILIKV